MSSSAFTPSTTTVTNNVPVNVPVVTAWEAYTPSLTSSGGGSITLNATGKVDPFGRWRRAGDSIEIEVGFANGSGGAATGNAGNILFSIPSGITIDSSKYTPTGSFGSTVGYGSYASGAGYGNGQSSVYVVASNSLSLIKGGSGTYYTVADLVSNATIILKIILPVSQWAGSGTTTLATRAVEEYAWNSDPGVAAATNYTNSAYYGNGPSGTPILSVASTSTTGFVRTTYHCRFPTAIQATDKISVEISADNGLSWTDASQSEAVQFALNGTAYYGLQYVEKVDSTTVRIGFGNAGRRPDASYGGVGAAWSTLSGYKWRVRKVSSGAQVGYPVSARNIVGDTSGTIVPTGMLGEKITWTTPPAGQVFTTTEADWTNATISLTAGVWLVTANLNYKVATAASSGSFGAIFAKITDSSNNIVDNQDKQAALSSESATGTSMVGTLAFNFVANLTTTTTYKIRGRNNVAGSDTRLNNDATARSEFFAIRIA